MGAKVKGGKPSGWRGLGNARFKSQLRLGVVGLRRGMPCVVVAYLLYSLGKVGLTSAKAEGW